MNKVGIITLQYPYNYGSALQAFALQSVIKKMGHDSSVINYVCDYDFENYKIFRWNQYIKRPKAFISDIAYLTKNLLRKSAFRTFDRKFMKLTETKYHTGDDLSGLNELFDRFVCGSDQIWNFECTGGVDGSYFLNFVNDKHKKIAYAPSMGQSNQKHAYLSEVKSWLQRFDSLSIREKSMRNTISGLAGKQVEVVLDPTLLLSADDYLPLMKSNTEDEYIFVYLLEPNQQLVDYVRKLAHNTGKQVIYISNITKKPIFRGINATNIYGASPDEFLSKIKGARYVVTNSFHATVFSILFNKQFCTFKTKKSFPRMLDLLQSVGLENRIFRDQFLIDSKIDYSVVESKFEVLRTNSLKYLQDALA